MASATNAAALRAAELAIGETALEDMSVSAFAATTRYVVPFDTASATSCLMLFRSDVVRVIGVTVSTTASTAPWADPPVSG